MSGGAAQTRIKNMAYKSALYGAALFVIGIAQVTFFSRINIFGATPDLLLAAIAVLALYEEQKVCALCGIISGFFYCAFGTATLPTYIIFSFLSAYILPVIATRTLGKSYLSYLALAAFAFALKAIYNIAEIALNSVSFNLIGAVFRIALPEFISSAVFCSISFALIRALNSLIGKKSKSRKEYIDK